MHKPTISAAFAAVLFAGTTLAGTALADTAQMQREMFGVSVQIDKDCSGTLIHSDRDKKSGDVSTFVLTAKHCVEASGKEYRVEVPVYQQNRVVKVESYVATVKGRDWRSDIALLELKDKGTWFETVAAIGAPKAALAMGEPVWTVGYPEGRALTVVPGMFTSAEVIDFPKAGSEYYRATPNVVGGNSGGGLFRMEDGKYRLIGVTSAVSNRSSWIAYYVTREDILAYLGTALPAAIGVTPEAKPAASN